LPNPNIDSLEETPSSGRNRTELEGIIAELWQDSLGLNAVGLQVNLFDLGANSLSVAEVATSLRQRLKREIPLTDFFAHPTITALAEHLSGDSSSKENSTANQDRGYARRQALLGRSRATTHTASDPAE
jgi:acyl carrier protein